MDISIYNDTKPDDEVSIQNFLLDNSLSHDQVLATIEKTGKIIQSFPLRSIGNEQTWLETHAQIHAQEFAAIGLTGLPDLQDVDMRDAGQLSDWMYQHSAVHLTVNRALGITS